jgi:glycosyltransferase involved in cell wall biosynthesis
MLRNATAFNQFEKGLVSIIIPTKNSASTLDRTLLSIASQTYKNYELIIVDNHSTDDTLQIAMRYTQNVLTFGPERTAQLNYGIKHAMGEYVYRVDSDFVLDTTVLAEAVDLSGRENCAAVVIHNASDDSVSFWSRVRKLERDMYKDDTLNVAARFFRKNILDSVGMFDESMVAGEDYDFHNRILALNLKVGSINAQEIHLGEPKTLGDILRKHYYYGKSLKAFLKKNRKRGTRQLMPVRPAYLKHWRVFARQPKLAAGFIVYQIARYLAAMIGYAVGSKVW